MKRIGHEGVAKIDKIVKAIQKWNATLKLNPKFPKVQLYMAKARAQISSSELKQIGTPTTSDQNKLQADKLYKKGALYYRQRNFSKARQLWKQTLKLDPQHKDALRGIERVESIQDFFKKRGVK